MTTNDSTASGALTAELMTAMNRWVEAACAAEAVPPEAFDALRSCGDAVANDLVLERSPGRREELRVVYDGITAAREVLSFPSATHQDDFSTRHA